MIDYDNILKSATTLLQPKAYFEHHWLFLFSSYHMDFLVYRWCFTLRPRKYGWWGWRCWKSFHSLPTVTLTSNARWSTSTSPKRLLLYTVNTTNLPVNRTAEIQERTFDGGDITARSNERLFCDFIKDLCSNPSLVIGCADRHYLCFNLRLSKKKKCENSVPNRPRPNSVSCLFIIHHNHVQRHVNAHETLPSGNLEVQPQISLTKKDVNERRFS
jgi:hypothetical protein